MEQLTLYELNNLVRGTLEATLSDTYWLTAELSEVRESRGHCYVEFVQKSERGNALVAKARGQIWAQRWSMMRPLFQRTTGQPLSPGMQVLVEVQVTFHELYGYSLNVVDIDPAYTLGDIARRRHDIMRRLQAEGVADMNKELPLPRLLQRIAVISSATAAGYQDFCNQLDSNPYHLAFRTRLFEAVMQGNGVEQSIIRALDDIAAQDGRWDAVVIIRGGGSTSDLSGFDTLPLAEAVAQFPLPVITGIGHERDDTVIDLVAHTRVKTPTAAAEFLIQHQKAEQDSVEATADDIARLAAAMLQTERQRIERLTNLLPNIFTIIRTRETARLDRLLSTAAAQATHLLSDHRHQLHTQWSQLRLLARNTLEANTHRLALAESKVRSAEPDHLLRLGFSIARIDGKAITSAAQVQAGQTIETTLAEGTIRSIATE